MLQSQSTDWVRLCLPTMVGVTAGPFAAAVLFPAAGVLWLNQSKGWRGDLG